jgi:hypothetical protein
VVQGLQRATPKAAFLFYHEGNAAWAIGQQLGDRDIYAFVVSSADRPENIRGTWQVSNAQRNFVPNPDVAIGKRTVLTYSRPIGPMQQANTPLIRAGGFQGEARASPTSSACCSPTRR